MGEEGAGGKGGGNRCTPCWDGSHIPRTGQPGGQGWDRVGRAVLPSPHQPPTLSRCKGEVRGCDSQFFPLNTPTPILSSRPGETRTRTDRFKLSWNFLLHRGEGRFLKLEQRSLWTSVRAKPKRLPADEAGAYGCLLGAQSPEGHQVTNMRIRRWERTSTTTRVWCAPRTSEIPGFCHT